MVNRTDSAYRSMLERLYALDARRGWDLKLESVRATLLELGSPEAGLETLHVAGTNGKGSVAAFAHSVLLASGASAGLYTSPHLEDFCERIRLGDREITPGEVVGLIEEVEHGAARAAVELTFFELTTVAALLAFARQPSRPAIVEVGLGGRLDATNVLAPRVTVITTVALDHESFLGSDLTTIAREKAGIVKPGTPLVLGRIDGEALAAIEEIAQAAGAPIRRLGRDFSISPGTDGLVYEGDRLRTGLHPGLPGRSGPTTRRSHWPPSRPGVGSKGSATRLFVGGSRVFVGRAASRGSAASCSTGRTIRLRLRPWFPKCSGSRPAGQCT